MRRTSTELQTQDRSGSFDVRYGSQLTRAELQHFVGITAEPTLSRTKRRLRALPVYAPGHHAHVADARARASELGIELAGNGYDGIGVPDCLASGLRAAGRVLRDPA